MEFFHVCFDIRSVEHPCLKDQVLLPPTGNFGCTKEYNGVMWWHLISRWPVFKWCLKHIRMSDSASLLWVIFDTINEERSNGKRGFFCQLQFPLIPPVGSTGLSQWLLCGDRLLAITVGCKWKKIRPWSNSNSIAYLDHLTLLVSHSEAVSLKIIVYFLLL